MVDDFKLSDGGTGAILFVDKEKIAERVDDLYAEKLLKELRDQLGWELKKGTTAYDHIREFSRLYSNENRDILEVAAIYRLAFKPGEGV
jgi:hypothetical protein